MYTIKGFTTKKNIVDQLKKAGVMHIRVPFNASPEFRHTKEVDFDLKDFEGKKVQKTKINIIKALKSYV